MMLVFHYCCFRASSVGIATGYELEGRGYIPGRGKRYFCTTQQILIKSVLGALSSGVKRPGRAADHSAPSVTEVNHGGAMPPFPHTSSWRGA
jgi:hypothetical protein